jgi:molybdopterin-guanine dinucleotide biosynthesis protein A|tara:strand:+ start:27 stop:632 length:606 start_codon:yes stop_codon:yes gene_type:complete
MDHNKILGVVLAGGKSQRFGKDKSQIKLNNKLLIDYILSEIIDDFKEVLIVANNSINHLTSSKITKIKDFEKNLGPLGGVFTAMKWINENKKNYQWISTFPADTPFFKIEMLKGFYKRINIKESELFFMKSNEKRHNIFGLWSMNLMTQLKNDLNNGSRKVETWANNNSVNVIDIITENRNSFFNINTPDDLEIAKKILND